MKILSVSAALATLATSQSALATSYIDGTFSGTVQSGYDINNTFGLGVGADLAGQIITGSFRFDPSAFQEQFSTVNALTVLGGTIFGYPVMQPPMHVTETINGMSFLTSGTGSSAVAVFQNAPYEIAPGVPVDLTGFFLSAGDESNLNGTIVDFAKLYSPDTIISNINDISTVRFETITGGAVGPAADGGVIFQGGGGAGPEIDFSVASMSVGPVSVPEPSTWMMMMLGFAGLGFGGYRRAKRGHATLAA